MIEPKHKSDQNRCGDVDTNQASSATAAQVALATDKGPNQAEAPILVGFLCLMLFRLIRGIFPFLLFGGGVGSVVGREGFATGFLCAALIAIGGQLIYAEDNEESVDAVPPAAPIPFLVRFEIYLADLGVLLLIGCLSFRLFV